MSNVFVWRSRAFELAGSGERKLLSADHFLGLGGGSFFQLQSSFPQVILHEKNQEKMGYYSVCDRNNSTNNCIELENTLQFIRLRYASRSSSFRCSCKRPSLLSLACASGRLSFAVGEHYHCVYFLSAISFHVRTYAEGSFHITICSAR